MGTNYYCYTSECSHCGTKKDRLHVGKSSCGWCFSLRVHPDLFIVSFTDWMDFLSNKKIYDEYGESIPLQELVQIITDRQGKAKLEDQIKIFAYKSLEDFYQKNHAEPGPNNLLRHKECEYVWHGEGTWDYINREFS